MGIVVFLVVCWLVAYGVAGGWPRVHRQLARLVDRLRHPASAPPPADAAPAAPAGLMCAASPDQPWTVPEPKAPPALADLEFPVPAPDGPSMEGRLVEALLAGAVSPEHYHKAMHVLAARDERAHPMPPVPS